MSRFNYSLRHAAACMLLLAAQAQGAELRTASKLAFDDAGTLYIADWKAARVYAVKVPQASAAAASPFNLQDVQKPIATALKVKESSLRFDDLAVQPGTGMAYISVTTGGKAAVVSIDAAGTVRRLPTADLKTFAAIGDLPAADQTFWRDLPAPALTVTDMKYHDGKLYLAGMSNRNFASALRVFDLPFSGKARTATVEMYHPVHNQVETRAPIRAMSFVTVDGVPSMVAAYTCTPLVLIPLDALQDGAHVRGKTVAELGYGNTPADMISYTMSVNGKTEEYMMLVNFNRVSNVIPVSELQAANARPGIEKVVPFGQIAGLDVQQAPLAGALRIDNLDDQSFVMVRRRLETDALQLVSLGKDLSFRMTDHVSEYAFRDYSFKGDPWQQQNIKPRQDVLLRQEGVPELIKPTE